MAVLRPDPYDRDRLVALRLFGTSIRPRRGERLMIGRIGYQHCDSGRSPGRLVHLDPWRVTAVHKTMAATTSSAPTAMRGTGATPPHDGA